MTSNLYKLVPHRGKPYKLKSYESLIKIPNIIKLKTPKETDLKSVLGYFEMDTNQMLFIFTLADMPTKKSIVRNSENKRY